MKTIGKDEFYKSVSAFLKSKGIEFTDGPYSERVRRGCGLLTDAINATQRTVHRAKTEVDRKLSQLRESIHNATASAKSATPNPRNAPKAARRATSSAAANAAATKKPAPAQARARRPRGTKS